MRTTANDAARSSRVNPAFTNLGRGSIDPNTHSRAHAFFDGIVGPAVVPKQTAIKTTLTLVSIFHSVVITRTVIIIIVAISVGFNCILDRRTISARTPKN